jgi:hypothetical protein
MAPTIDTSHGNREEEMTTKVLPNSALDRTTFRSRSAALRSTGAAGQRGR